jgi:nitroimidazol reductase NimA-like FMN-containing flavoprotein (pyridoxamine 5'-phosphate oxidase superfamily)
MDADETAAIMRSCTHGVLACWGDDGYPYAVPVNYVYADEKIYFHSAAVGHKIDAVARSPKVSFAVVAEDTIVSEEFTSHFRSAIAFGTARVAHGAERLFAFRELARKYSGDQPDADRERAIADCPALIVAIDVAHLTGKQAKEYAGKALLPGAESDPEKAGW